MNDDCVEKIIMMMADIDGATYKVVSTICKRFTMNRLDYIDKHANHVASIVKKYGIDCGIDYVTILKCVDADVMAAIDDSAWIMHRAKCENRVIDIRELMKLVPCEHSCYSSNPNISMEIIRDRPDYKWDLTELAKTKMFTFEVFRDNLEFWLPTSSNSSAGYDLYTMWELMRNGCLFDGTMVARNVGVTWECEDVETIYELEDSNCNLLMAAQNMKLSSKVIKEFLDTNPIGDSETAGMIIAIMIERNESITLPIYEMVVDHYKKWRSTYRI